MDATDTRLGLGVPDAILTSFAASSAALSSANASAKAFRFSSTIAYESISARRSSSVTVDFSEA